MNLTSPLTGSAQTGFTSPTYTLVSVAAPSQNGKQFNVSAIGGTQPNVLAHSVGRPFTITLVAPSPVKLPPTTTYVNQASGFQPSWPKNTQKLIVRKNVKVNSTGAEAVAMCVLTMDIPVGAPDYDLDNLKAMFSSVLGSAVQDTNQWWQAAQTGSV